MQQLKDFLLLPLLVNLSVDVCCVCVCVDGDDGAKLTTLKQQNGYLAQVEVDEVTRLVGDVRSEVAANDAMPCWIVLFVELLLDVSGDVL